MADTLFTSCGTENSGSPGIITLSGSGYTKVGETFLGVPHYLSSAQFYCCKNAGETPDGNLTVVLYNTTGTFGSTAKPTGAALVTSNAIANSAISDFPTYTLYTFTFASSYLMTNGTVYALSLETSNTNNLGVVVRKTATASPQTIYAGNNILYIPYTWYADATVDTIFYAYYNDPVTSSIKKVSGVAQASISKIAGVSLASIKKVASVANS